MIENAAVQGITLTDEIEKVITNCPYIVESKPHDCFAHCPLCEVCYHYYVGE